MMIVPLLLMLAKDKASSYSSLFEGNWMQPGAGLVLRKLCISLIVLTGVLQSQADANGMWIDFERASNPRAVEGAIATDLYADIGILFPSVPRIQRNVYNAGQGLVARPSGSSPGCDALEIAIDPTLGVRSVQLTVINRHLRYYIVEAFGGTTLVSRFEFFPEAPLPFPGWAREVRLAGDGSSPDITHVIFHPPAGCFDLAHIDNLRLEARNPRPASSGAALSVAEFQPNIPWSGRINSIALHPTNRDVAFVATDTGGLFRTPDAGRTWHHVHFLPAFILSKVAFFPGDPRIILVTAQRDHNINPVAVGTRTLYTSGGGIWISRDGGDNWQRPDNAVPRFSLPLGLFPEKCPENYSAYGMSFEPETNKIFVATDCGVSISEDTGRTWTHVLMPYMRDVNSASHNRFSAIAALGDDKVVVGGTPGVWYSENGGRDWIPPTVNVGNVEDIHAIAPSPTPHEVFLVSGDVKLYRSGNDGVAWEPINTPERSNGCGGIAFIKLVRAERRTALARRTGVRLYFGDRCSAYVQDRIPGLFGDEHWTWSGLRTEHADARDIGMHLREIPTSGEGTFSEAIPVMLANDGGLELSRDGGNNWTPVGSGPGKINALQIYQVAGSLIGGDRQHLIFGTQDNSFWYSADGGRTWVHADNEGDHIEVQGLLRRDADAVITHSVPGRNRKSKTSFHDLTNWPDPGPRIDDPPLRVGSADEREDPSPRYSPALIRGGLYIQPYVKDARCIDDGTVRYRDVYRDLCINGPPSGVVPETGVQLTSNYGEEWHPIAVIGLPMAGGPQISKRSGAPTAYQAVLIGTNVESTYYNPNFNVAVFKLVRVPNLLTRATGAPIAPAAMHGFGALGRRSFQFDWRPVFGVDPEASLHLIAPDAVDGYMKESWSGGDTWEPITDLTELITRREGREKFAFVDTATGEYLTNVTAISFNPMYPDFVLVGTRQGGAYFSQGRGRPGTWTHVPGSERMHRITSFYWTALNEVVVSTYGRGLWKINIGIEADEHVTSLARIVEMCGDACRLLTSSNTDRVPLKTIPQLRRVWSFDAFFLTLDGRLIGTTAKNGVITGVTLSTGSSHAAFGKAFERADSLTIVTGNRKKGAGRFDGLPDWVKDAAKKSVLIGITFQNGKVSGAIVSDKPVPAPRPTEPPRSQAAPHIADKPHISILASEMMSGIPTLSSKNRVLFISGYGFDPTKPIEIAIDGVLAKPIQTKIGVKGDFNLEIKPEVELGPHRVIVHQRLEGQQEATDAGTFFVRHED